MRRATSAAGAGIILLATFSPVLCQRWFQDFSQGLVPGLWWYPLNGTCFRLCEARPTYDDANSIRVGSDGATFSLTPENSGGLPCPDGKTPNAAAVGGQLATSPCTGPGTYGVNFAAPVPNDGGSVVFFGGWKETPNRAFLQFVIAYVSGKENQFVIGTNGNTTDGHFWCHEAMCTVDSGFDPTEVHEYSVHWDSDDSLGWYVDGQEVIHTPAEPMRSSQPCVQTYINLRANPDPLPNTQTVKVQTALYSNSSEPTFSSARARARSQSGVRLPMSCSPISCREPGEVRGPFTGFDHLFNNQ